MTLLHDNINEAIRSALLPVFNELVIATDRLSLRTVKLWPLQDDPTKVAPYVVFGPMPKITTVMRPDILTIGGPTFHWAYWRCGFGTPQAPTREQAYDDIEELASRIEHVLEEHYNIGGLKSAGGGEQLSGNNPATLILGDSTRIFGGDAEFYGIGTIVWRYSFERTRNWTTG